MPNQPSLFTAVHAERQVTIDLSQLAAMSVRPVADDWIVTCGGVAFSMPTPIAEQVHAAWIAYRGKFNPQTDR